MFTPCSSSIYLPQTKTWQLGNHPSAFSWSQDLVSGVPGSLSDFSWRRFFFAHSFLSSFFSKLTWLFSSIELFPTKTNVSLTASWRKHLTGALHDQAPLEVMKHLTGAFGGHACTDHLSSAAMVRIRTDMASKPDLARWWRKHWRRGAPHRLAPGRHGPPGSGCAGWAEPGLRSSAALQGL